MAKQDEIPTTVNVSQSPVWAPDQLLVWFNQVATWIKGAQAVKTMPITEGGTGSVLSLRVGPMIYVQGTVTPPGGTNIVVTALPVECQSDTFLVGSRDGLPIALQVSGGSRTLDIPGGLEVKFSGWYLGTNSKK